MNELISIGLSPNLEFKDVKLALKMLINTSVWASGSFSEKLERIMKEFLHIKYAISFESGRSSLFAIISLLNLKKNDEVLLQAYTCVAVPDAIIWAGAKPVYVDIDSKTLNMSAKDLRKKVSARSKVLIIQHTFGLPADVDVLLKIAKDKNLFVIEDCAHALGAKYRGQNVGTLGDAAIFSFGRDKVISSVFGGMATTSNRILGEKLLRFRTNCQFPSRLWIIQQLIHPIATFVIKETYLYFGVGKILMAFLKSIKVLSKAVYQEEKSGGRPVFVASKMPNSLAALAISQFQRLSKFNSYRKELAKIYIQELQNMPFMLPPKTPEHIFLRFTVQTKDAQALRNFAAKRNIFLGDWYTTPVAPADVDLGKIGYIKGTCPDAEKVAKISLNLPTNPNVTLDQIRTVILTLKDYGNKN